MGLGNFNGKLVQSIMCLMDEICGLVNVYYHIDNVIETSSVKATADDFDCTLAPKVLRK